MFLLFEKRKIRLDILLRFLNEMSNPDTDDTRISKDIFWIFSSLQGIPFVSESREIQ